MRISDWSSDVCSSDLGRRVAPALRGAHGAGRPSHRLHAGDGTGAARSPSLCPGRAAAAERPAVSRRAPTMSRLLPYPLLSLSLLALWLLLNQSLGPGHLLLGTVLAVGGGLALTALEPPRTRIRRPPLLIALAVVVLRDIIRPNIPVHQTLLHPNPPPPPSPFPPPPPDT